MHKVLIAGVLGAVIGFSYTFSKSKVPQAIEPASEETDYNKLPIVRMCA
jgi:hypothetical protein